MICGGVVESTKAYEHGIVLPAGELMHSAHNSRSGQLLPSKHAVILAGVRLHQREAPVVELAWIGAESGTPVEFRQAIEIALKL